MTNPEIKRERTEPKKAGRAPESAPRSTDADKIGAWRQKIDDLQKFKADIEIARDHLKAQNVDAELARVDKEILALERKVDAAIMSMPEAADEDVDEAMTDEQILKEQAAKAGGEPDFEITVEAPEEPKVIVDEKQAPGAVRLPGKGRKTLRKDIGAPDEVADEDIIGQVEPPPPPPEALEGISEKEVDEAFKKIEPGKLVSVKGVKETPEDVGRRLAKEIAAEEGKVSPFEASLRAELDKSKESAARAKRVERIDPEIDRLEKDLKRYESQAENMDARLRGLEKELGLTEEEYERRQVTWWGRRLNDLLRFQRPEQFDQFVALVGTHADKRAAMLDIRTALEERQLEIDDPEEAARRKKKRESDSKNAYLRRLGRGGNAPKSGGGSVKVR